METQESNGQPTGQEDVPQTGAEFEGGDEGNEGQGEGGDWKERYQNLEAKFDLLQDGFNELRSAIVQNRNTPQGGGQASSAEVDDDDEDLTPSKVNRLIQKNLQSYSQQADQRSQRQVWDDKAKGEFPLNDPKFQLEFKKTWREQVEGGLDPNHPRAIYNVAKITSQITGRSAKPAKRSNPETTHTSEAPSRSESASARSSASRRTPAVGDDDPRVAFYKMKGNRTAEQIENMKRRLAEKDGREKKR